MNEFYTINTSPELDDRLKQVDHLKNAIDQRRPLKPDIWSTIQNKLKIDWTYDSNAIEGSSLSRGETFFFLQEGLTVEGKPLKDFLDARNHADAIDFLFDVVKNERKITEGLIKEMNALLLSGIRSTSAMNEYGQIVQKPANPGQYKKLPNHVLQMDGTIHYYADPLDVQPQMQYLCEWINENMDRIHPAMVAATAHYNLVRIHPFDDGNGRGARLLMNLILMKKSYPPAIVRSEKRRFYLECLIKADRKELNPFIMFMAESLLETESNILKDLE
ncbi:Fic family protein [Desulforegula conservatrix]|uniref:Fic family protein n=1 Tax=Desulforegula conservatrix TaxID=153026 RepID=UPI0004141502|nr:Fic family protein [Desulforegula conservatrix]